MIIVGLTGGIGSGKSTASEMFRELGAHVIDYDILARQVVEPYQSAWNGIVDTFGNSVLNRDMTINREKLAEIVFDDSEKLQALNRITHPAVFDAAEKHVEAITALDRNAFIIKDVPLLIETGIHKTVAKVIVVEASVKNRLDRLEKRGLTNAEAMKRIESQMLLEDKINYADFVINNDGPLDDTYSQVKTIFNSIKRYA